MLIFENCQPVGNIPLPTVTNLNMETPQSGSQTSQNIINGKITSQNLLYFSYPSIPQNGAPVSIPSFTVQTDRGSLRVPAASFTVVEATVGETSIPVSYAANSKLEVGHGPLWAGEVVPVDYTLSVSARFRANLGGEPAWDSGSLIVEEWSQPTRRNEGTGADVRNLLTYSARGYISQPGNYEIPSVQQLLNIGVPSSGFLQSLRAEQYSITSDSPSIVVRPLPSPSPNNFTGAVGDFTITSKVIPETAAVGEPVTWTLTLKGTGNWPEISSLPAREVSRSFRIVQPQANRDTDESKLFEGSITEDVVLIATQTGSCTLMPVEFTYFDPRTGNYRTITTPETELTIDGSALTPTTPQTTSAPNAGLPSSGRADSAAGDIDIIRATPAPVAPAAIPRDPLPGQASAFRPLSRDVILGSAIGVAALLPLLWLTLSWRHARHHDQGRLAREARKRISRHISAVQSASSSVERDQALLHWQHDCAWLWRSQRAAPSADMFECDSEWTLLWQESERALYGDNAPLAVDWTDRALKALANKRAPRFSVLRVLALRHLFPAFAILGICLLATDGHAADDPIEAYSEGDFAAAADTWASAATDNSLDWIAHHNLALALAQQNRWDEAGAQAAVAFVQNPRDPSVRWHLNYTLERSGYTPPVIGTFTNPGRIEKLAREASPAEWQRLLLGGLLLGVIALALVLGHAYGMPFGAWQFTAWFLGVVSVAVMITAVASIQTWGLTADARAVLTWRAGQLRSIPTDLKGEQQTTALSAGSLAVVEKAFLGWQQISFPNGQTGWIRQEELVPLWTSKP